MTLVGDVYGQSLNLKSKNDFAQNTDILLIKAIL